MTIIKVKNIVRIFLFIICGLITLPATANRQTVAVHPLLDDLVLAQPINRWSYWFYNTPGYEFGAPSKFILDYAESPTLKLGHGGMTISLNGMPLASRFVPIEAGGSSHWEVTLPVKYFRAGMNELRIISRQRSLEGLCTDSDNSTNWIKLKSSSQLVLSRNIHTPYPLSVYPFPFLDTVADSPVRSCWQLPASPTERDIEAMLTVATNWGRALPNRPLRLCVHTDQSGHQPHRIGFGQMAAFSGNNVTAPLDAGLLSSITTDGSARLQVMGGSADGMIKAADALGYPNLTSGLLTTSAVVSQSPTPKEEKPGSRYGAFSFADLGVQDIRIAGAFHQMAIFTVPRPLLSNIGEKSYLELHFLHSASLNPNKSILVASINGRELGSVRLSDANANNGVLKVPLPPEILQDSVWNVTLNTFHELSNAACDKFYDAVAWTLIDKESTFYLDHGGYTGTPFLERFPYLRNSDGNLQLPVTCWLPANPTPAQLSAAATIAVRAGQVNQARIRWQVMLGDNRGTSPAGCVIAIANTGNMGFLAPLRNTMRVAPNDAGSFNIAPEVQMLHEALRDFTLLQAHRSPWDNKSVVYTLLSDQEWMLDKFSALLTNPRRMDELKGEICLLNRAGTLVSYDDLADTKAPKKQSPAFWGSWGDNMIQYLYALLFVLALVGFFTLIKSLLGLKKNNSTTGGGSTQHGAQAQQKNASAQPSAADAMQVSASFDDQSPLYLQGPTLEEVLRDLEEDAVPAIQTAPAVAPDVLEHHITQQPAKSQAALRSHHERIADEWLDDTASVEPVNAKKPSRNAEWDDQQHRSFAVSMLEGGVVRNAPTPAKAQANAGVPNRMQAADLASEAVSLENALKRIITEEDTFGNVEIVIRKRQAVLEQVEAQAKQHTAEESGKLVTVVYDKRPIYADFSEGIVNPILGESTAIQPASARPGNGKSAKTHVTPVAAKTTHSGNGKATTTIQSAEKIVADPSRSKQRTFIPADEYLDLNDTAKPTGKQSTERTWEFAGQVFLEKQQSVVVNFGRLLNRPQNTVTQESETATATRVAPAEETASAKRSQGTHYTINGHYIRKDRNTVNMWIG